MQIISIPHLLSNKPNRKSKRNHNPQVQIYRVNKHLITNVQPAVGEYHAVSLQLPADHVKLDQFGKFVSMSFYCLYSKVSLQTSLVLRLLVIPLWWSPTQASPSTGLDMGSSSTHPRAPYHLVWTSVYYTSMPVWLDSTSYLTMWCWSVLSSGCVVIHHVDSSRN